MSEPSCPYAPPQERRSFIHGVTGILEAGLIIALSIVAAIAVTGFLGLDMAGALGLRGGEPDFLSASAAAAVQLGTQYGVLFALAALTGWLRGRRSMRSYAIASPRKGIRHGIAYGVVLGLLSGVIPSVVLILQDVAPIGRDAPMWAVFRGVEWNWQVWLFLAIGSFAVIPLLEEGAWRGYVLGRLAEGMAPGAAVILTTLAFSMLHVQYLAADAALLASFGGLLLASLAFGLATLRTGSLLPAIIAHVIINFPSTTEIHLARLALAALLLIVFRRAIYQEACSWAALLLRWSTLTVVPVILALAGLAIVILTLAPDPLVLAGLLVALFLTTGFLRRSAWAPRS